MAPLLYAVAGLKKLFRFSCELRARREFAPFLFSEDVAAYSFADPLLS